MLETKRTPVFGGKLRKLEPAGALNEVFNKNFYECMDCGTVYCEGAPGWAKCNGKTIGLCPWCRPDSKPWENGRGA